MKTTNNPITADDDVGEFAALKTLDVIAAYLYQRCGEEAVRQAFGMIGCNRESLEDAVEELEARGLDHVAATLRDIAKDCPSGIDLDNPYEEGSTNWHYWRQSWIRRRRIDSGELEADLRKHHAQKQQQIQAKHSKASNSRH